MYPMECHCPQAVSMRVSLSWHHLQFWAQSPKMFSRGFHLMVKCFLHPSLASLIDVSNLEDSSCDGGSNDVSCGTGCVASVCLCAVSLVHTISGTHNSNKVYFSCTGYLCIASRAVINSLLCDLLAM